MEDPWELMLNQTDADIESFLMSFLNDTENSDENIHIDFRTILDNLNDTEDDNDAGTGGYNLVTMAPNFILAMNISLLIIGLLGNTIACIVILRSKFFTATNYYLLNLSISDVLVLLTRAPFEIYSSYYRAEIQYTNIATCFIHYLGFQTAVNVSTLTVTIFTVERYLAICHPFVAKSMLEISLVKKIIACIWLVAVLFAFSPYILDGFDFDYWNTKNCSIDYNESYAIIFSTIFFFIPTALIATLYILIGIKLSTTSDNDKLGVRDNRNNKKTLRMLALIVLGFFLCWAPFYAMEIVLPRVFNMIKNLTVTGVNRPLINMKPEDMSWDDFEYEYNSSYVCLQIVRYLILFKRISCTLAPTINPIIYTMMSKNFRVALKELFFYFRNNSAKWKSSFNGTTSTTITTTSSI